MRRSTSATSAARWRDSDWTSTAFAGFLCAFLSGPGQTFVLALYVEPIMESLDASRTTVANWYAMATLIAAVGLVPVGRLADRWPPERFLASVIFALGAALLALSRAASAWPIVLALTMLRLAGQGATGVGILTLVARRYSTGRARLLSLAQLGHPAGELVFPSVVLLSLSAATWRHSSAGLGLVYLFAALPMLIWLLARTGHRTSTDPTAPESPSLEAEAPADGPDFGTALRAGSFWCAATAFAVPAVVVTALVFHQVAVFRWAGWPPALVPVSFASLAVGQVVTTAVTGSVADRWSPRRGAVLSAGAMVGALACLLLPGPAVLGALAHGGLLGTGSALSALIGALVWPHLFGLRALGGIRAASSALRNAATAAGPLLFVVASPGPSLAPGLSLLVALSVAGGVAGWPLGARRPSGMPGQP